MLTTFLTISSEDVAAIVGYGADLIGNLMPVIVVILGISLGLWIFDHIFHKKD